mgnify:CR=1 FL=1
MLTKKDMRPSNYILNYSSASVPELNIEHLISLWAVIYKTISKLSAYGLEKYIITSYAMGLQQPMGWRY